ncbi:putative reverse transcriptase domain-containing protein [Tanacetum coccineum]
MVDLYLCAQNATTIIMGSVTPKCNNCKKVGHLARNYRSPAATANNQRAPGAGTGASKEGLYKWNAGKNPNSNVVTCTFLLNNQYASVLFDTGADKSFVSTAFSSLVDILFDVIIGMDWLMKYHAVIVCDKKIVRVPFGNEILIVRGDRSNNRHESQLNIISCTKTQKYFLKGCHVFLSHVTTKKSKDKSEDKQLEDVPIPRNFPEVFTQDLSGIPPTRQVEFKIDLIPGVAPVARAPYRLALAEMKELSDQLQELSDKGFIRPISSLG